MSDDGTVLIDGRSSGRRLPRGRHGIPRELILANQRERLLSSTTAIFVERGLASLRVADVIDRAGVSRATFYRLFEDKWDCVRTAQAQAFKGFSEAIATAFARKADWPSGVAAAVGAALDFAALHPSAARLLLASSHAQADPQLGNSGLRIQERLIELLREGAISYPDARIPSGLTERAAIGAALSIIAASLAEGEVDSLIGLRADLVRIILAPYLGDYVAKRVAMAA